MIYQISNATVQYGADTVLDNIQFEIRNKNEKIAVVGRNGCGKTTLLKLMTGEVDITQRDGITSAISMTGDPVIGYLKQLTFEDENITLDEEIRKVFAPLIRMQEELNKLVELMGEGREELAEEYTALQEEFRDIGGYYYEKEYDMLLKRFGFADEDKAKRLSDFSGGQRTKLAFIKLLLSKPDILLLDEPTNHLDITTIEWLETYLKAYNRAVVVVSHDRMFLDKIADTVYEIEHHRLKRYPGNYSTFVRLKKEAYDKQLKDYNAQQKEIDRLNAVAERFMGKPTKVSMAKSKLKAIEHMDIIEAPDRYDDKAFRAEFTPRIESGKDVLSVRQLAIGYDSILTQVSFELKRGERLGIIGGNGIGKSTLLKTLVEAIQPLSGEFSYGTNVEIGYFDQQMAQYVSDKTVIDDFWDQYPSLTQTEVRNALGALLFTGDEVFKDVRMLSGGEKVRLALAKIFKSRPNMLILDEPTNHMDMVGKETLESMLRDYPGTVIFVSHDRYFVKKTATRLMIMDNDSVRMYEWGYEQYEEELAALQRNDGSVDDLTRGKVISYDHQGDDSSRGSRAAGGSGKTESGSRDPGQGSTGGLSAAQQSYLAGKEQSRQERRLKKLEEEIERLEREIEDKKTELNDPANASDYVKLQEIQDTIDALEEKLLDTMTEWSE
jgi:ATP-binding cassette subfamily F protein 3